MKKISGTSHSGAGTPAQADSENHGASSSEDASPARVSHRGRTVVPENTEENTASISGIDNHNNAPVISEEPRSIHTREVSNDDLRRQRKDSTASYKSKEKASRKRKKERNVEKEESREREEESELLARVIEWQGSTEKQLEKLVLNVKKIQDNEKAEKKARKKQKDKASRVLKQGDGTDSTTEGENSQKTDNDYSLRASGGVKHNKASEEENNDEMYKASPGFFHFNHPGQGMNMSRSYLLAHLEMVESIEDILIEVLKVSSNKPNIHSLGAEVIREIMEEIQDCVDRWIKLPPEDAAIHPREALKQLLGQYKNDYGEMLENDAEHMNDFIAQCRQLFPIEESGSLDKADTHHNQKPAPVYVRKVSGKIRDILKYQDE